MKAHQFQRSSTFRLLEKKFFFFTTRYLMFCYSNSLLPGYLATSDITCHHEVHARCALFLSQFLSLSLGRLSFSPLFQQGFLRCRLSVGTPQGIPRRKTGCTLERTSKHSASDICKSQLSLCRLPLRPRGRATEDNAPSTCKLLRTDLRDQEEVAFT